MFLLLVMIHRWHFWAFTVVFCLGAIAGYHEVVLALIEMQIVVMVILQLVSLSLRFPYTLYDKYQLHFDLKVLDCVLVPHGKLRDGRANASRGKCSGLYRRVFRVSGPKP